MSRADLFRIQAGHAGIDTAAALGLQAGRFDRLPANPVDA
jgi:hypothetical protein